MTERRLLIAGNWKMHGLHREGVALAAALAEKAASHQSAHGPLHLDLLICPPATLSREVSETLDESVISVGGQDCHTLERGAHTGDVSAAMLKDAGCSYVIVGHSERRADHGENNDQVKIKAAAAHACGLTAIICIGETREQRDRGEAMAIVGSQLAGSLPNEANASNTVIAYEPVWAIGTGLVATVADVAEIHAGVRAGLAKALSDADAVRVLYGGSVKPDNAAELMELEDVDGALVGGASLDADDFWAIAATCL
ncbi:MAG: triose-phosphate isomerase [Alphaproteobacteria bacterium]|nr:triose-phosphate isomerase [Alphaproteobacteria bacterium]